MEQNICNASSKIYRRVPVCVLFTICGHAIPNINPHAYLNMLPIGWKKKYICFDLCNECIIARLSPVIDACVYFVCVHVLPFMFVQYTHFSPVQQHTIECSPLPSAIPGSHRLFLMHLNPIYDCIVSTVFPNVCMCTFAGAVPLTSPIALSFQYRYTTNSQNKKALLYPLHTAHILFPFCIQ